MTVHETDHSPSRMSNTEVTNEWSYNSIPPYALKSRCLIKHKRNSIFHSRNIFHVRVRVNVSVNVEITVLRDVPSCNLISIPYTLKTEQKGPPKL